MIKPKPIRTAGDAHRRAQASEAARAEAARQAQQKQSGVRALRHEDIHNTR